MYIIAALWLVMRLLSGLLAAVFSGLQPLNPLEQQVALWPPSEPLSLWLERVCLSPWLRWDAHWYVWIVSEGYLPGNGTTQFHPLYIWLSALVHALGLKPLAALLLVSSLSGLGFAFVFQRLAGRGRSPEQALFATLLLLAFPVSLVLFAPYTEATFLLFSALSLYAARQRRWGGAGLAAGLALLTRQQGIFLLLPLAWLAWQEQPWRRGLDWKQFLRPWLGLAWLPAAQVFWLGFRWRIGDLMPDFSSLQAFVYSVMISPAANQVVPQQAFLPPWSVLALTFEKLNTSPDVDLWINLIGALFFLVLFFAAWPRLDAADRLYSLVMLLVSFSYYTGSVHPLMGLLRHCYLAFPLFWGAADALKTPWARLLVFALCLLGQAVLILLYVLEVWVL